MLQSNECCKATNVRCTNAFQANVQARMPVGRMLRECLRRYEKLREGKKRENIGSNNHSTWGNKR